jgi:hypothetical protein
MAGPVLLEPIMAGGSGDADDFMGNVVGDLSSSPACHRYRE